MHPLGLLKRSSGCRPPFDKIVLICKVNFRDPEHFLYDMFAVTFTEIVFFLQTHEKETAHGRIPEGGTRCAGPDRLKITKLPGQHSLNGVSLAGQ